MQKSNTLSFQRTKIISLVVLVILGFTAQAQQALTLKEAIQTALKNLSLIHI